MLVHYLLLRFAWGKLKIWVDKENLMNSIWLTLLNIKGLGNGKLKKIYELYPKLELSDFNNTYFLEKLTLVTKQKSILDHLKNYNALCQIDEISKNIIEDHKRADIQMISIADEGYPKLLRLISDPPIVLYCKGNISLLKNSKAVAIVGTREPSIEGIKYARGIARRFSNKGYTIVSGLAKGIDTEAHYGAIEVNGYTIAVLPSGLDKITPKENQGLAQLILNKDGLLMSEYPLDTTVHPASFAKRNRIQTGLSLGVCPVQTNVKGGTQQTIKYARNHKRFLFGVHPNEDIEATKGIGQLINEGVFMIKDSQDIELVEEKINEILLALLKG